MYIGELAYTFSRLGTAPSRVLLSVLNMKLRTMSIEHAALSTSAVAPSGQLAKDMTGKHRLHQGRQEALGP